MGRAARGRRRTDGGSLTLADIVYAEGLTVTAETAEVTGYLASGPIAVAPAAGLSIQEGGLVEVTAEGATGLSLGSTASMSVAGGADVTGGVELADGATLDVAGSMSVVRVYADDDAPHLCDGTELPLP